MAIPVVFNVTPGVIDITPDVTNIFPIERQAVRTSPNLSTPACPHLSEAYVAPGPPPPPPPQRDNLRPGCDLIIIYHPLGHAPVALVSRLECSRR